MTGIRKRAWYRQPLLHFLIAGVLLFVFYEFRAPSEEEANGNVIVVDRAALLDFMQFRSNAFNASAFERQLESMSAEDRRQLIDAYAREEALYREALAMGLDQGDYNIKQRLVEKVSFLLEAPVDAIPEPTEEELRAYYEANVDFYRRTESYTFVHVFVADAEHTEAGHERAESLLEELRTNEVDFRAADGMGDTFPNRQYFNSRSADFIRNNFDDDFFASLQGLDAEAGVWHGPLTSNRGYHLVNLTRKLEARTPPLDEIHARVLEDYRVETAYFNRQRAESNLVDKYQVEIRDR